MAAVLEHNIDNLRKHGVGVAHLSSCMQGKSANDGALAKRLAKDFDVVGHIHGCLRGSNGKAVCLDNQPA